MHQKITLPCEQCGANVQRSPSQIKAHTFCSPACSTAFAKANAEDPLVLFWADVRLSDHCWEWVGPIGAGGYGAFGAADRAGLPQRAHRASWIIHFGPIPDGLNVLHHCDNRPCVRPSHLFLGTQADNIHDMIAKGRHAWAPEWMTKHQSIPAPD
jgi:hypothetical protein